MDISVIVCTHNRAECLKAYLPRLFTQAAETVRWEILVVANACTDTTEAVAGGLAPQAPVEFRLVRDAVAGLGRARNTGARHARGRYLVYLDDDAWPDAGWLAAYAAYFARHPDVEGGGGPIELGWESVPKPAGWKADFEGYIGRMELDAAAEFFPALHSPYGGNMFVRADALNATQGFNIQLGMRGRTLGMGEETAWFLNHAAGGKKLGYVAAARVFHRVEPGRLTAPHLRRRAFEVGRSQAWFSSVPRETRGWLVWTRALAGRVVRGKLDLTEQLQLARWAGRLRGQSQVNAK